MVRNTMHAIHPESQEDTMEWYPIFEFQMFEQKRKDEEKNNSEEVLHSSQNLCVHHTTTDNTDNISHQKVLKVTFNIVHTFFNVFIIDFI